MSCRPVGTVFGYARGRLWQGDTFTGAYTYGNALLRRNSEYPLYDGHGSERTVTNGFETGTCNTADEPPAREHETRLRGFMAIPRMRDSHRMPDDSSSGTAAWGRRTNGAVSGVWLRRLRTHLLLFRARPLPTRQSFVGGSGE